MRFLLLLGVLISSCASQRNDLSRLQGSNGTWLIKSGETFVLDQSIEVKDLVINGTLVCDESVGNIELKASSLTVNGTFQCGTKERPFTKKLTLSLVHSDQSLESIKHPHNHTYRSLSVNRGGRLILHGSSGRENWVKLNATAKAGDNFLSLDQSSISIIRSWSLGDEIVIGPTSYRSDEAETFRIRAIDRTNKKIFLDGVLKHQHWGEVEEVSGPANGKRVLDERAEVANLTRNIVIQGSDTRDELGAHVMVMRGGSAYIDNVELKHMGQAGIMGRYPFHWHMAGNVAGQYVTNSSIHESFQRCVVIHETHEALVRNNVCSDFKGHGFFLETGNEINNRLIKNLAINARFPSTDKVLLASEALPTIQTGTYGTKGIRLLQFSPVASFWISHPRNEVVGNVASGSVGTGLWMAFAPIVREYSEERNQYDGKVLANPLEEDTLAYADNVSHSCAVGQSWEGAPDLQDKTADMMNKNNPMDRMIKTFHYAPKTVPLFQRNHAWKNVNTGLYFRGDTAVFEDSILADNGRSVFFVHNQIIRKSTIVGRSRNHTSADDESIYSGNPLRVERQSGIILYDGPLEIDRIDFINFPVKTSIKKIGGKERDITSVPIEAVGSLFKFSNTSRNVYFNPSPVYKVLVSSQLSNVMEYVDVSTSQHLIDADGSLTGEVGANILPNRVVDGLKECHSDQAFVHFRICPPTFAPTSLLSVRTRDRIFKVPFLVKNQGKILSVEKNATTVLHKIATTAHYEGYFQNKFRLVDSPSRRYSLESPLRKELQFRLNSPRTGSLSPIISVEKLGLHCELVGAQRVDELVDLEKAQESSYCPQNNGLFIKLKATHALDMVKASTHRTTAVPSEGRSPWYSVVCH